MDTKICSKCGEEKKLNEFCKYKRSKNGLYYCCKKCKSIGDKIYCCNNKEKIKKNKKIYQERHKDKIKLKKKIYYQKNIKEERKKRKIYYINNREKAIERARRWKINNIDRVKNNLSIWYKKNKDRHSENTKKWRRKNCKKINEQLRYRKRVDIHFKLRHNITSLIRQKLKNRLLSKNKKPTFSFLPYTIDDLIKHLESLWEPWMNWQNYGFGKGKWVIDHYIPDSRFDYKSVEDEEFQKCWALENLKPIDFIENAKKGNKIL